MPYFQKFPTVQYGKHVVTDITRVTKIKNYLKANISFFEPYRVQDGERPEDVANAFYDDPEKHWILLLINDVIDPFFDWVMPDIYLKKYITAKYGVGNENDTHHWILDDKVVPPGTAFANIVTHSEYEDELNEARRVIKVVKSKYIDQIEAEFEEKILV